MADAIGMLSELHQDSSVAEREPRPFHYLKPARLPLKPGRVDAVDQQQLDAVLSPVIPQVVRCLVDYTIARDNRGSMLAQPIQMSVLNRRRRAARSWVLAIAEGRVDAGTRHAVATKWLPLLSGTGPDLVHAARPGRDLLEFVRGAITAEIFANVAESLLPQARALHALESTLAVHLVATLEYAAGVRQSANSTVC